MPPKLRQSKSVFDRPAAPAVETVPRDPSNVAGLEKLSATPLQPELVAPAPDGVSAVFKPTDATKSMSAQLAEFMGRNDLAVAELAKMGDCFTKDGLERKNQERVNAWNTGPAFPIGASGGAGANVLQPFVNAPCNRERLNAGTPVRPELGAPFQRGIGNAWGQGINAGNWAAMADAQTQSANIDVSGRAQVAHTGNFLPADVTTSNLFRGGKLGGPLSGLNYGGVNAGAVFTKQDGAAGGTVGLGLVDSGAGRSPYAFVPPSGTGALANISAYGVRSLLQ